MRFEVWNFGSTQWGFERGRGVGSLDQTDSTENSELTDADFDIDRAEDRKMLGAFSCPSQE